MRTRLSCLFLCIAAAVLSLSGCFNYQRKYIQDIKAYIPPPAPAYPPSWAAGPDNSSAFLLAGEIAAAPAFHSAFGIAVAATEGSLASLERLASGKALLATVRADHALLALQGENRQIRSDTARSVCSLEPVVVHIIVKNRYAGGQLQSLPDNATIITDSLWEGGSLIARSILRSCGIRTDRFLFSEAGLPQAAEQLRHVRAGAAILTAPPGDGRINAILKSGSVSLVSFPPSRLGDFLANRPYALPFNIVPGAYAGQKDTVHSIMIKNLLLARVDAPADDIHAMCTTLFPCLHDCSLSNTAFSRLSHALEGICVPIHPGAIRYYDSRCEFFTGNPLGTYYDLGRALAKYFNESLGPVFLTRTSSGALENIQAVQSLRSQFALVQGDIAYKAYSGDDPSVPSAPAIRAVACLSPERIHLVASRKSGVMSITDIAGKRINLGELGSGTMLNAVEVLTTAGVYRTLKKEHLFFYSPAELLLALHKGKVDCFFTVGTDPSEFLTNLMATGKYTIVSLPQQLAETLTRNHPYYTGAVIQKNCYPHQSAPVHTISTVMLMITHRDCDPAFINRLVTLLGEKSGDLPDRHPLLYYVSVDRLWTRSAVPFHDSVRKTVSSRGWQIRDIQPASRAVDGTAGSAVAPEGTQPALSDDMRKMLYPSVKTAAEDAIGSPLAGDSDGKEKRFLSLHEATLIALRENLSVAIDARNPLLKQLDVAIRKAEFYPTVVINARQQVRDRESVLRSKQQNLSVALREKLPTGAEIAIGSDWITLDDSKSKYTHASSAFLEMNQPLLEGIGLDINLADYRLARENAEISIEDFRNTLISTLSGVRSQYYELLRAFESLVIEQQTLELARVQAKRSSALALIGKVPESELTIANARYAARKDNVVVSRRNYEDQEDTLLELLRARFRYTVEPSLILPLARRTFSPVYSFSGNEMSTAFQKRPDVRNILSRVEKSYIQERVAQNSLLPSLDLSMRLDTGSDFFKNQEDVLHDFRDFNDVLFSLGLGLELPVPNTRDRSRYIQSKLAREQALLQLDQIRELVQREVREATRRVESAEQRVPLTKNALIESEKQIAEQLRKFNNGETDNFNVFQAINDFADARLAELNALVDYYQAVVDLYRTLGITDDVLKISVYSQLESRPGFNEAYPAREKEMLRSRD